MHRFWKISLAVTVLAFALVFPNQTFAQMESMKITGNQFPEVDSVFNIQIIIEGISRASGETFNIQITIQEKDSPFIMDELTTKVFRGTNTIGIDLAEGYKPYTVGAPYVIEVQHTDIFATFEFSPIENVADAPITIKTLPPQLQKIEMQKEIDDLKEQLEKKDAVIMEQIKTIENLASMLKKTIFEPILNYFHIA